MVRVFWQLHLIDLVENEYFHFLSIFFALLLEIYVIRLLRGKYFFPELIYESH